MNPAPQRCAVDHGGSRIEYTLVRTAKRRRTIGIMLQDDGEVVVRAPVRASRSVIEDIVRRKAAWIERVRREAVKRAVPDAKLLHSKPTSADFAHAREVLNEAVERWSAAMGCSPSEVLVRSQKRIWGSCARDGTLRLNWRLVLLPQPLIDYVVVHELVHLRVRNHQREFWSAVGAVLPDYKQRRARLRQMHL